MIVRFLHCISVARSVTSCSSPGLALHSATIVRKTREADRSKSFAATITSELGLVSAHQRPRQAAINVLPDFFGSDHRTIRKRRRPSPAPEGARQHPALIGRQIPRFPLLVALQQVTEGDRIQPQLFG
jgi:hypothetical protein